MQKATKFLIGLFFAGAAYSSAMATNYTIKSVDASAFPTIKATMVLEDNEEKPIQQVSSSDFTITEANFYYPADSLNYTPGSVTPTGKEIIIEWQTAAPPVCQLKERLRSVQIGYKPWAKWPRAGNSYSVPKQFVRDLASGQDTLCYTLSSPVIAGEFTVIPFSQFLCNQSLYPVTIDSIYFFNWLSEFSIESPPSVMSVAPGSCLDPFSVKFAPGTPGKRQAFMIVKTTCGESLVEITAEAVSASSAGEDIFTDFEILPNPSDGIFLLKNFGDIKEITVSDMLGNRVFAAQDFSGERFSLAGCAEGIYILHARLSDGRSITKKLVLNR